MKVTMELQRVFEQLNDNIMNGRTPKEVAVLLAVERITT